MFQLRRSEPSDEWKNAFSSRTRFQIVITNKLQVIGERRFPPPIFWEYRQVFDLLESVPDPSNIKE